MHRVTRIVSQDLAHEEQIERNFIANCLIINCNYLKVLDAIMRPRIVRSTKPVGEVEDNNRTVT